MLKSASVRIPDIWRVETIKDRRIQVMPPHDKHNPNLREMHALLQEMKTINDEGLHAQHDLDHLEFTLNPFTAYKNYKEDKAVKDNAWNEITVKWATLSRATKRSILHYVVEHDVKDAWSCVPKIISDKVYKATTTDESKKNTITELIDLEDSNTAATIENMFEAFAKNTALKAVIITKVRDEKIPTQ